MLLLLGSPFGGFVFSVRCVVEINEPLNCFRQADLALSRDVGLVLFHAFVARQEQRFGVGVFLLAESTSGLILRLHRFVHKHFDGVSKQLRVARREPVQLPIARSADHVFGKFVDVQFHKRIT